MAAYEQKPLKRMSLTDMNTLEEIEMQFNPEELIETIRVAWARLRPPGLSHERLQYDHTENYRATFKLVFDALVTGDAALTDLNVDTRNFLASLCYTAEGATTVNDGQPTRVLFVWPSFISLTAVIGQLKFHTTRFAQDGRPTFFTVDVELEEIRDTRLFSADVRAGGKQISTSVANVNTDAGE